MCLRVSPWSAYAVLKASTSWPDVSPSHSRRSHPNWSMTYCSILELEQVGTRNRCAGCSDGGRRKQRQENAAVSNHGAIRSMQRTYKGKRTSLKGRWEYGYGVVRERLDTLPGLLTSICTAQPQKCAGIVKTLKMTSRGPQRSAELGGDILLTGSMRYRVTAAAHSQGPEGQSSAEGSLRVRKSQSIGP